MTNALKSDFVSLANSFMDDDFTDFKKSLIMRTAVDVPFGNPPEWTLDPVSGNNFAIPLTLDFSMFDNTMIEIGDFLLFTNVSVWNTDPNVGNVDLNFDGVIHKIINVEKDPADAAYFLTVRRA